jgi:transcriptional regulator with XRE-family HTH domain
LKGDRKVNESHNPIGERIDKIRIAKGMTLRVLAERSDLAESYICKIIRGKINNLTLETIRKIADNGLGVPIGALFGTGSRVVLKIGDKRPVWCTKGTAPYKIAEAVHKFPKEAQELVLVQMESFEKFFTKPKRNSTSCLNGCES